MSGRWPRSARAVPLLLLVGATAVGQEPSGRPRLEVPQLEVELQMDGLLDEAAWAGAARIGGLTQVEPVDGVPASPGTEILLMRDERHLYVGLIAWEPQPQRMVLQNMRRDAFLNDDDRFEIVLDTFRDGKTAYFFQLSAAGSRGDALIADNGQRFNKRWDGFWEGRAAVGADRWTAELAIPFRTLAFGGDPVWRANFERYRGVDRSRARWAGASRNLRLFTVSEAGELVVQDGLDQGHGVEVVPYYKVRAESNDTLDHSRVLGGFGGELNWRLTPQLTGSVTVNTDFAETETDERRVNLSRFPLFFPEKRDFFLEDSNLFEFGEQSGFGSGQNLLPFFSRRIGLGPDGEEIPIEAGARLAGRVDAVDLGLLAVSTEEVASAGVPAGELFVARPSYRVDEDLALGALLTYGDPSSEQRNLVTGLDARLTSTELLPGTLSWNTWWVRSDDEASGEIGYAYGTQASLRQRDWSWSLASMASQGAFLPALGFVRRPGERRYQAEVAWEPRPGDDEAVRKYEFRVRPSVWTDLSGETQSYDLELTVFGLEWHDGDELQIELSAAGDRLDEGFSPVDGSTIPAGDYDWQTAEIEFEFSEARPLSGRLSVEGGSWYDGSVGRVRASMDWRPSAALRLGLSFREDRADLPGGDFATRVGIMNADLSFSPDLALESLVQLDNESDLLGLQSRLRWVQQDGRELFVVVNSAWQELPGGTIVPISRDLTVKLVFALRF